MTTFSNRTRLAAMAGIAAALVVAFGCAPGAAAVPPAATGVTRPRSATGGASTYADGVYAATGQYGNLPSSITVTVTLADGVIRAVEVTPHATDPTSLDFQRRFAAAVPAVVVGRRIDEVGVDRVAGSSGTLDGFNAAIQRIREQARSERTTAP